MRIAWIGTATDGGGVGGFGRMLVQGLLDRGESITLFSYDSQANIHTLFGTRPNLTVVHEQLNWDWNRWYSKHPVGVFISSFAARAAAYKRLVARLVAEHQAKPFDVCLQFSQTEIFSMAKYLDRLPPVLLFPCVHAAGELRWHRRESKFALQSEPWWRHQIVRANLILRSRKQRQSLSKVYGQIGMSKRFNQLMREDYGVRADRQAVVYQPMPLQKPPMNTPIDAKVKLVYVGRISVRKGLDLIIDLSHRLRDLEGQVQIKVVGGPSFWSDYTRNLSKLNPHIATYVGAQPHEQIMETMASADALLIPSQYEPGGIVVAEALSQGCRIVASDEVGSAEPLSDDVCYRFAAGDGAAFESAVRRAVSDSQSSRSKKRSQSIAEACSRFDTASAIDRLVAALRSAAERRPLDSKIGHT